MRRLASVSGYIRASLVLATMSLTPFVLMPRFIGLVGRLGIRVHPKFTGGPVVRTMERGAYQVAFSAPAGGIGPLEQQQLFIQVSWSPLSALPDRMAEPLDLDGDGRQDAEIILVLPKNRTAPLVAQVNILDSSKITPAPMKRSDLSDLSSLLVRLEDRVLARFPVK